MRLIDADELRTRCTRKVEPSNNSDFIKAPTWNDAMSIIDDMPTVDPVKHGRWIETIDEDERVVWCSRCGDEYNEENINLASWVKTYFNYCPNCGAKMDEEE